MVPQAVSEDHQADTAPAVLREVILVALPVGILVVLPVVILAALRVVPQEVTVPVVDTVRVAHQAVIPVVASNSTPATEATAIKKTKKEHFGSTIVYIRLFIY